MTTKKTEVKTPSNCLLSMQYAWYVCSADVPAIIEFISKSSAMYALYLSLSYILLCHMWSKMRFIQASHSDLAASEAQSYVRVTEASQTGTVIKMRTVTAYFTHDLLLLLLLNQVFNVA